MSAPPDFDPVAWEGVPTATLSDAIGRLGAMDGGIRRMCGSRLAGRAYTVVTAAGDSSTIHRALQHVPPGSVVVVDAQGGVARAVWGNILTVMAMTRGVVGAVIDGATRDIEEIAAVGFPLYARGTCPAGPHKGFRGSHGVPIQCGGVVVHPGDVVVGDGDGITVVPAALEASVRLTVEQLVALEHEWLERIRAGESTVEILGLE